ncbi:MAG TPA: acyl-CoA desaturase [Vicinamibacterales bacterium]|nr:acyl-CoA desaturase [Vicinamibacterales bacterium]
MTARRAPQFPPHSGFYTALRAAVHQEIAADEPRDPPAIYAKIAVIVAATIALYAAYLSLSGWVALVLALPFGLLLAAIGFNVQHDGGHESLSRVRFVNRLAAFSLDLLGGSSYVWRWKHNVYHHTYPNIGGVDSDIEIAPIGRLAEFQQRHWVHRYQHVYLWFLYALLPLKWHFVDDFRDVLRGRIGDMPLPRPRGLELVMFVTGKAAFFITTFVVPSLVHGVPFALTFYLLTSVVVGLTLSVVFQLAHCVEDTAFYAGAAADEWAVHQIATTMNFAPRSRVLGAFVGGLNFQIEHHLFPRISHVHYPRIAPVVQRICAERGVAYHLHDTFGAALRSHYRMLRANGR